MYTKMLENNKLHKMLSGNNRDRKVRISLCFLLATLLLIFTSIPVQAVHLTDIADSIDVLCTETKAQISEKYSDSAIDALEEAISNIDKVNGHNLEQYECKASNFIEGAISKTNKYVYKLNRLVKRNKVPSDTVDPLIKDAGDIVDALNHELPGGGAPASAGIGADLYAGNLCMHCHAVDGSGGIVGVKIEGEENCDIYTAMMEEEVHGGITITLGESNDLAAFLAEPGPLPFIEPVDFADPKSCRICHPRQYEEWQGTMMSYGAISPTFSALEFLGNNTFGGALARMADHDQGTDLFCQRCHNPIDVRRDIFPTFDSSGGLPLRSFASDVGQRGLSCDYCHQVKKADTDRDLPGDLQDGIANVSLVVEPGNTKYGPLPNPQWNPIHSFDTDTNKKYLQSSEFCGGCHDVRPRLNDVLVADENFQRLEDLFTEWQKGPFGPIQNENTPDNVVSCQDCHMDAGPPAPAATYYDDEATVYPRPSMVSEQRVSTHYFTGVDIALVPFPSQDVPGLDSHGNPIGQLQRRDALLKSALDLTLSAPLSIAQDAAVLPITVNVRNVGAGHNVPSGFSQERQCWIELTVTNLGALPDDQLIYRSGYLVDKPHPETGEHVPDGLLNDEDLENVIVRLDPATGEVIDPDTGELAPVTHGPDYNFRHDDLPVNLGLANFGNEFLRVEIDPATGEVVRDAQGEPIAEEVFTPFLANHTDNTHSIPPLEEEIVLYDVPLPGEIVGPIQISTRMRFRPFPPRFLRLLAQARPDLVNEALVDRNVIVEMAEATPVNVVVEIQ